MTTLLEEIRRINKDAARALEKVGFRTDLEIKSLSRIDLNELLPGLDKLQVRRKVFEKIQNGTKKPIDVILRELKSSIPHDSFQDALTSNGAAIDYLNTLKELKDHLNQLQMFIDAHISLLERLPENQDPLPNKNPSEVNDEAVSLSSSSSSSSLFMPQTVATGPPLQTHETGIPDRRHQTSGIAQTYTLATVMYQMILTGKTLNADQDVLKQAGKRFVQGEESFELQLEVKEDVKHCKIIIVFCPVVSRVGTDVESAMRQVPHDKDIILVLMHHTREPKASSSLRTWSRPEHVVLDVNVFFHDTVGGLLCCKENDDAVTEIQRKLLDYSSKREKKQMNENRSSRPFNFRDSFTNLFPNMGYK